MDLFELVGEFNRKMELPVAETPCFLERDLHSFRVNFIREELDEYLNARVNRDLEGQLDALVDMVYVILGTAHFHGFNFNEAFRRVHEANMQKQRAQSVLESKRSSLYDCVKPAGWKPADLSDLC